MRVALISTYELGHQPLHVASPAAALRAAGHEVRCLDLSVEPWDDALVDWAQAVAASVPMHTAMRLALGAAERIRTARPGLPIAFYGLYAPVSRERVVGRVVDRVIAGEYEPGLVAWVDGLADGAAGDDRPSTDARSRATDGAGASAAVGAQVDGPYSADPSPSPSTDARSRATEGAGASTDPGGGSPLVHLDRSPFATPVRDLLPGLDRYARVVVDGEERLAGYTEASHGCAHECRHCPIPAVYGGRTRLVDRDVVLADVAQQVEAGARHITFGDPDFLNGWRHALRVVTALHERFPDVTYDVTVKVEHILRDEALWEEFAGTGCLFAVSAVECLSDRILGLLDKGHTAADAARAVEVLRAAGIEMRPSFLPFTPWASAADVADIFDFVADHDLVANVDPVQYSIRLLLPTGSLLLNLDEMRPYLDGYDDEGLSWRWHAADAEVEGLQRELAAVAEEAATTDAPTTETFVRMRQATLAAAGHPDPAAGARRGVPDRLPSRPGLTEPWFCCAEPTAGQFSVLGASPAP